MTARLAITLRGPALAALLVLGVGAYVELPALAEAMAYLLPALAVLLALLLRRYPGERKLLSLLARRRRSRRHARHDSSACGRRARRSAFPRGGDLIGASLAERAPPLAATART
jgi:hypothetical protein